MFSRSTNEYSFTSRFRLAHIIVHFLKQGVSHALWNETSVNKKNLSKNETQLMRTSYDRWNVLYLEYLCHWVVTLCCILGKRRRDVNLTVIPLLIGQNLSSMSNLNIPNIVKYSEIKGKKSLQNVVFSTSSFANDTPW